MSIEIARRAEALDQRHGARRAARTSEPGFLENVVTVSDPQTFTQPCTLGNSLWRTDEMIYEVGCHEGNIGLAGILGGARAQEK
jgi:hypothetical protein